jgi:hypothetical protein
LYGVQAMGDSTLPPAFLISTKNESLKDFVQREGPKYVSDATYKDWERVNSRWFWGEPFKSVQLHIGDRIVIPTTKEIAAKRQEWVYSQVEAANVAYSSSGNAGHYPQS